MDNIFDFAARCLFDSAIDKKLALTHQARQLLAAGALNLESSGAVLPIKATVLPEKPLLMTPGNMPRRRLNTDKGKAAFYHALAHIEFMAIYLAWDIIYRFRGLPAEFYRDWLCIADEEAQHFALIRAYLLDLGLDYGDLPAHRGLWTHAEDTADELLARLAIVPRCMEARGLDVTPAMIEKLQALGDQRGVAVLERIYRDEIGHVERGSYWFNRLAQQQGFVAEQIFIQLLINYYKGKPKGPFNREVRIIAGFSDYEIDWLEGRGHD